MRKVKFLKNIGVSFLFVLCGLGTAFALPPQPPDIRVQIQGPTTAYARSPYQYTVNVKNIGGARADGVIVYVDFPQTNTSPQVYILGTLSGFPTNTCQVVSRRLKCTLGNMNPNATSNFTFSFAYPVSTKTLEIKATGSSTSGNEANPNNNIASIFPTNGYATNQLTSATVLIKMCTGRNLSSFFECELFPSSQQQHIFTLNADNSVTAYGQNVGTWDQLASPQQLHLWLSAGNGVAEFNGFASSNTCFEGITTFTPANGYNSAYKVCVQ